METASPQASADFIRKQFGEAPLPPLLLVLGSGWGPVVDELMEVSGSLAYADIPGFPVSTVEGHQGRLLWGRMAGVPVWVMQGRFHYYEGYSLAEVTFPIRVFSLLGIRGLILTNAAGGICPEYRPGQLMVIEDHINFMGDHPLRGPNADEFGPRFPDMTAAWDERFRAILTEEAGRLGISLPCGVYLAVSGPSFETPAEIRAFSRLGASAVGMSTVPECLVARHAGLRVLGLSCITNLAAHCGGAPLSHEEVAAAAGQAHANVIALLEAALPRLNDEIGGFPHVD